MNHRIWLNPHAVGSAAGVRDFLDQLDDFEIHEKILETNKKFIFGVDLNQNSLK